MSRNFKCVAHCTRLRNFGAGINGEIMHNRIVKGIKDAKGDAKPRLRCRIRIGNRIIGPMGCCFVSLDTRSCRGVVRLTTGRNGIFSWVLGGRGGTVLGASGRLGLCCSVNRITSVFNIGRSLLHF